MSGLKLNTSQLEAIQHTNGPLLIIAGAGTGKTTVVTERIKHLITSKAAQSSEILGLTFTEKAAQEMQERVDIALPYGYTQMWISTFHSFCDRVLRNDGLHIGLDTRYRLMTEAEAIRFFREHLFEFDLKYFRPLGNPTKFISGMLQHFSRLRDEDISPNEYFKWAKQQAANSKQQTARKTVKLKAVELSAEDSLESAKWLELAKAYELYEQLKAKNSVADFSDLISNTLKLFRARSNVLEEYKSKFKYVLVDEFQDTNIAQNELVKLLVNEKGNITVVADDDQAIYKWRGASISNVIQFRKSFPKVKIVALTQNYRSVQRLLDASYKVIQNNNPDRLEVKENIDKRLVSARKIKGEDPEFLYADRVENEADLVVKKINELVENGDRKFSDFAILVRANIHADPFSRALARAGIPYQFLGPGQLFKQEGVRDLIAYLKVLYDFTDSPALYRILSMDHFTIPARDLSLLALWANKFKISLFEAAESAKQISLSREGSEKIDKIIKMIYKHLKKVPREAAGQLAYYFLEDSGILENIANSAGSYDARGAQNLSRFFDKLKTYEADHEDASVFNVVDWIDLSMDLGESPQAANIDWMDENAVSLLTIHSSKGLEFPVVFVVNLVSQRFPSTERGEQIPIPDALIKEVLPSGDYHLQEERRLYYVAMTRARDRLFITAANYYGEAKREKKLSPFVYETFGEKVIHPVKNGSAEQLSILDSFSASTSPSSSLASHGLLKTNNQSRITINYLSYSQIDTFNFCPLHYKLKNIYKIPTSPSAPVSFGNTLHMTLREFNERQGIEKLSKKDLLEIYARSWLREGYHSKAHEEQMKVRGIEYLKAYLSSSLHKPNNPPKLLETKFIFPLNSDLKIGGIIDRIDVVSGGIEIVDYKTTDFTSKELPTDKDLAKNLQLSIYAMAATRPIHEIFGRRPEEVTLSLYYLDLGVKVSTKRTLEDLEKATEEIIKVKEEMEISSFACSGHFWCKNCEYKLYCKAG